MLACQSQLKSPTTPNMQRLTAITHARFSLFRFRSPLLTESLLLSLPEGTEMFHFPSFPPHALCVQAWVTGDESSRVSPFGNPRITVRLPTPRGLSQAPTSFIGSWCQGIHRAPLLTWSQSLKMLASTVQFSRYGRHRRGLVAFPPATMLGSRSTQADAPSESPAPRERGWPAGRPR